MNDFHFYEPARGHGLAHDPFNSLIAPRPIGWIGSRSADGAHNLAPYSFFNAFNYSPPIIGFSSTGSRDTLANVEATGEFTWNLVTRGLAEAMNATSTKAEVDEFNAAGLTAIPGEVVAAPRVLESPASMECRLIRTLPLTSAAGEPTVSTLVLGEVVGVHLSQEFLTEGTWDTAAARPVVRGGGPTTYFGLGERFDITRPS